MAKQIEIIATFDENTKRMHRFIINEGQAIRGNLYILQGDEIPDLVIIHLKTRGEVETEKADVEAEKQNNENDQK